MKMNKEFETSYLPEMWMVRKDDIYNSIHAIMIGLIYIDLAKHDEHLKPLTKGIESDEIILKTILNRLKELRESQ